MIVFLEQLMNTTIEERVAVLEFQVNTINDDISTINDAITTVNNDVSTLSDDVTTLETEVRDLDEDLESQLTVISGEQVLQDERLFTIEQNEEGKWGSLILGKHFYNRVGLNILCHHTLM